MIEGSSTSTYRTSLALFMFHAQGSEKFTAPTLISFPYFSGIAVLVFESFTAVNDATEQLQHTHMVASAALASSLPLQWEDSLKQQRRVKRLQHGHVHCPPGPVAGGRAVSAAVAKRGDGNAHEQTQEQERLTYANSGVDIDKGNAFANALVTSVSSSIGGGFGGVLPFMGGYLIAGTDGVGTKLEVAQSLGFHRTIGIDLVAMCANDVAATGASPLLFLDYLSTGQLDVEVATSVVQGVQLGCESANCTLLGGETAEMPGFYLPGHYDIAGFCVGFAEEDELLDGSTVRAGDYVIGLPATGIHANGMSLARKAAERANVEYDQYVDAFGRRLGEELLEPTAIYVQQVRAALKLLKAAAHITGGGLIDNIPRVLPDGLDVELDTSRWEVPKVFRWVQESGGGISEEEMRRTFNMGIGMVLIMDEANVSTAISNVQACASSDENTSIASDAKIIGQVVNAQDNAGEHNRRVHFME